MPPPTNAPTPAAAEQYYIDCGLGLVVDGCPCMSDFDCNKDTKLNGEYDCLLGVPGELGTCAIRPVKVVSEPGLLVGMVAARSDGEAGLLGWHVMVIVIVIVLACVGGAYILYWAQSSSPNSSIDYDNSAFGTSGAGLMADNDAYASATFDGGDSMYAVPDSAGGEMTLNCPDCGKEYHFQSDLETHLQLRHGGGTMSGGGSMMGGGYVDQGGYANGGGGYADGGAYNGGGGMF